MSKEQKKGKAKLVIATDNFLPRWDGIARFLDNVIPGLEEHFDVVVVAPAFGHTPATGFRLLRIPLRKGHYGDISFAKLKYWLIKREVTGADVVFTQTVGPIGGLALIAARRLRKPLVSYIHSLESELVPMAITPSPLRAFLYPLMRSYTRWLYNKPDLLLTPSEHVDDELSWQGVVTPKRVIRLGVDTKKFSPGTAKTLRSKLGFAEDDVVIGQVGRLAREKDVKTLLRAFIRLSKTERVKLLVVADGLESIKRLLDRPGVVCVPGADDVVPYLRAMDVFVMTSLTETTCLAALEAMSVGLPVVSTPVGFVRDYIVDGKNGFFFPFRDTYKLSSLLEWLVRHPMLRARMGDAARELVVKEFSWEQTVAGIVDALVRVENREAYPSVGKKQ